MPTKDAKFDEFVSLVTNAYRKLEPYTQPSETAAWFAGKGVNLMSEVWAMYPELLTAYKSCLCLNGEPTCSERTTCRQAIMDKMVAQTVSTMRKNLWRNLTAPQLAVAVFVRNYGMAPASTSDADTTTKFPFTREQVSTWVSANIPADASGIAKKYQVDVSGCQNEACVSQKLFANAKQLVPRVYAELVASYQYGVVLEDKKQDQDIQRRVDAEQQDKPESNALWWVLGIGGAALVGGLLYVNAQKSVKRNPGCPYSR